MNWFPRGILGVGLTLVALGLSACGGASSPQIASAATGPSAASAKAAASSTGASAAGGASGELADYITHQRAWVACMAKHSYDFPDPDKFGRINGASMLSHRREPAYMAAMKDCAALRVPVPQSVTEMQGGKLTAQEIATERRYSKCMQTHGAPAFPDPDANGYIPNDKVNFDETSAGYKSASAACGSILGPTPTGVVGKG